MKTNKNKIIIISIIAGIVILAFFVIKKTMKEVNNVRTWIKTLSDVANACWEVSGGSIIRKITNDEAVQKFTNDAQKLNAYNVLNSEITSGKWQGVESMDEIVKSHENFLKNNKGIIFKLLYR